jgi:hypothetical protein
MSVVKATINTVPRRPAISLSVRLSADVPSSRSAKTTYENSPITQSIATSNAAEPDCRQRSTAYMVA